MSAVLDRNISCALIKKFRWIAGKISEILGTEDDVVIELCFNLLEGARFVSCKPPPSQSRWVK
jgi:hypothetical protein